jgi:hypothetical protein
VTAGVISLCVRIATVIMSCNSFCAAVKTFYYIRNFIKFNLDFVYNESYAGNGYK